MHTEVLRATVALDICARSYHTANVSLLCFAIRSGTLPATAELWLVACFVHVNARCSVKVTLITLGGRRVIVRERHQRHPQVRTRRRLLHGYVSPRSFRRQTSSPTWALHQTIPLICQVIFRSPEPALQSCMQGSRRPRVVRRDPHCSHSESCRSKGISAKNRHCRCSSEQLPAGPGGDAPQKAPKRSWSPGICISAPS